jgi:hypothetical protein
MVAAVLLALFGLGCGGPSKSKSGDLTKLTLTAKNGTKTTLNV